MIVCDICGDKIEPIGAARILRIAFLRTNMDESDDVQKPISLHCHGRCGQVLTRIIRNEAIPEAMKIARRQRQAMRDNMKRIRKRGVKPKLIEPT